MDLSVVIVNWRSADYLRACLSSIVRNTRELTWEAIVVNNDPEEDLAALADEFSGTVVLQPGSNLGFSRANNLGFRYSSGEFVLFLNPDTEVVGATLEFMVRYLRGAGHVGALGAKLLNTDGTLQTSCVQSFPTIWNQLLDFELLRERFPNWRMWGTQAILGNQNERDAQVISGACLLVRRRVFDQVRGFDECYFMYADDLDLSYRIRQAGYDIHCLHECEVIHHGGKSASQQPDAFADIWKRKSLAMFFRKTRGNGYALMYRASLGIMALARLLLLVSVAPFTRRKVLQGKARQAVVRKWWSIFVWTLGLSSGNIRGCEAQ